MDLSNPPATAVGVVLVSVPAMEFIWIVIAASVAAVVFLGSFYYLILAAMRVVDAFLGSPTSPEIDADPELIYLNCGAISSECLKEEECAICLERLTEGSGREVAGLSICEHVFHPKCLMKWMSTSRSCPMCRRDVDSAYVFKLLVFPPCPINSPLEEV